MIRATLGMMAGLALVLAGCSAQEGPAERAGRAVDEAAEDVEEGAEEVVEKVKE